MVLLKRLDYGFNDYQVPSIPRAPRSGTRRNRFKKNGEGYKLCPFDLLATVADKLSLEGEPLSPSGNLSTGKDRTCAVVKDPVKKEDQGEDNKVKAESSARGKCNDKFLFLHPVLKANYENCESKEYPPQVDLNPGVSVVTTSDCLKILGSENLAVDNALEKMGCQARKIDPGSFVYEESSNCKLDCEPRKKIKIGFKKDGRTVNDTKADMCSREDSQFSKGQPHAHVSLDSNLKMSLYRDDSPKTFTPSRDNIHLVSRDDDDNSSGCSHPITIVKSFRSPSRIGHRRTRKPLASKYWKESPRKNREHLKDGVSKPAYNNWNHSLKRQRSQRIYPFKKRKFLYCSSYSDSDGGISSESISDSPEKVKKKDASVSSVKMHGEGTPSVAAQQRSFQSSNSHVNLRIKSFRVPELFIEIAETATVGSLKRTVKEAVTALLGGGLHIGVLVQGKKVKDDKRTLLQSGISNVNKLDALDFTLEPNSSKTSRSSLMGDPSNEGQTISRYLAAPAPIQQSANTLPESLLANSASNFVESDHDSAPSPIGILTDNNVTDSRALVAVPAMDDALAVVPVNQKRKRSESAQRRIRRPFSVVEVEALVQAVEELGTGRWRDVKMQAFDDAKHRTYVDLKDKWKTLVHTARISPQQRRGEPVPQELLDRVLTAHAYWSQQQAKQQHKQQLEACRLSLN